jgi:hypothetical protein
MRCHFSRCPWALSGKVDEMFKLCFNHETDGRIQLHSVQQTRWTWAAG